MRVISFLHPLFTRACMLALLLVGTAWAADPAVEVESEAEALAENLQASLDVSGESCELDPLRQRLLERNLSRRARDAARAVGYYEADIELRFEKEDDCWTLRVQARPGRPVLIDTVEVKIEGDGRDDEALRRVIDELRPETGAVLRHDAYQQLRDRLLEIANQRGYFDLELTRHRLEVDAAHHQASILLTLETGPRYRFGDTSLMQDILRDEKVRPYLTFSEGEPWDTGKLLASQQALLGSGYFATARIERAEPDPESLRVPLQLHLTPRKEWAWMAGVGVSTDTGPRIRLGAENRYINRRGHRWRAQAEASEVRSSITSAYEIPLADPVHDKLVFAGGYESEQTDTSDSEQLSLGASLINELPSRWILTRSLEFEREVFEVGDDHETTELLMPGIQLQRVLADDPIYPTRGWKLGTSLRGTHPSISSTDEFAQAQAWLGTVLPFFHGRFLTRAHLGYTEVDEVGILPASVRFFAGGDNSVRGFDYETLGPVDADGDVIGGRHLLTGSLELEYPLFGQWYAAVFSDTGNAFNDVDDMGLRNSAGAGIRWRSPLGPIRIDFARPVDASGNWRLHLSMGPDL